MERLGPPTVSISNGNIKYPITKSIFAVNLPLKFSTATTANADIGSVKSLHTLFGNYLHHMLVEFEQNCLVQTIRNLNFLTKNSVFLKKHF